MSRQRAVLEVDDSDTLQLVVFSYLDGQVDLQVIAAASRAEPGDAAADYRRVGRKR